LKQVQV